MKQRPFEIAWKEAEVVLDEAMARLTRNASLEDRKAVLHAFEKWHGSMQRFDNMASRVVDKLREGCGSK